MKQLKKLKELLKRENAYIISLVHVGCMLQTNAVYLSYFMWSATTEEVVALCLTFDIDIQRDQTGTTNISVCSLLVLFFLMSASSPFWCSCIPNLPSSALHPSIHPSIQRLISLPSDCQPSSIYPSIQSSIPSCQSWLLFTVLLRWKQWHLANMITRSTFNLLQYNGFKKNKKIQLVWILAVHAVSNYGTK